MAPLQMTKWLEMVWDALAEDDSAKREGKLHSAQAMLREMNENLRLETGPKPTG
jgi:hypothetical protein